ncbi:hypothetical protein ACFPYM_22300, partial [Methylobacterium hispanicum]
VAAAGRTLPHAVVAHHAMASHLTARHTGLDNVAAVRSRDASGVHGQSRRRQGRSGEAEAGQERRGEEGMLHGDLSFDARGQLFFFE